MECGRCSEGASAPRARSVASLLLQPSVVAGVSSGRHPPRLANPLAASSGGLSPFQRAAHAHVHGRHASGVNALQTGGAFDAEMIEF